MYNKERIKTIVSEWFEFKTGIILSDETLSKLVDDITETKQCDIPVVVRSAYLVQNKNTLVNHGLFDSEEKAVNYIKGNTCDYGIQKVEIA